jgi:signal peptidase II
MRKSHTFFFLIAISVYILDQLTKYVIKTYLSPFDVIKVLPFLNIIYTENTGSAFGMFKSLGNAFFIIVSAAAVIIVSVLIIKDRTNRAGLSLILGGAAGNLTDRLIHGYVIDFIDIYAGKFHWPAFNVADSALTVGIALLVIKTIFSVKKDGT